MEFVLTGLTEKVIGAAIEVHKALGPGLLESAYEECLCHELALNKIAFERQKPLPLRYKSVALDCSYRVDVLVEKLIVIEIKALDATTEVHEAQLLSYLRLGGWPIGLLINFNVARLTDGIVRRAGPAAKNFSLNSVPQWFNTQQQTKRL
jgi:GxxExxY protein